MLTRRAVKRQTCAATIRTWRDGQFSIAEVRSLFDGAVRFLVIETLENGNQIIISRHRKRSAAVKALPSTLSRKRR